MVSSLDAVEAMTIPKVLEILLGGGHLSSSQMRQVMRLIMSGGATPAQVGGFLMALRAKGETIEEIVAAAEVIREMATQVPVTSDYLVDTCGTGGDGAHTFNISTAAAFVASAAGARVAKHGSRSVSSSSGSADVLEAAGVHLVLNPDQVRASIDTVGLGFLFAQHHHSAMQQASQVRRELGVRTMFNLLGPLTNPAGAPHQVVGVFSSDWVEPLAHVLKALGSHHVLVVHAEDGLDEISLAAPTFMAELKDGAITMRTLTPESLGFERQSLELLAVTSAAESLAIIRSVFDGAKGPARDIVLLNAAAAIYVSGVAPSLEAGVDKAKAAIDSGAALKKLESLISFTRAASSP